jgi:hypothetical protein
MKLTRDDAIPEDVLHAFRADALRPPAGERDRQHGC